MPNPTCLIYLLRLWQEDEQGPWRAMLETFHPAERTIFATLPDLTAYLEYRTGEQPGGGELLRKPSQGNNG